jgi:hypothetical protein
MAVGDDGELVAELREPVLSQHRPEHLAEQRHLLGGPVARHAHRIEVADQNEAISE